MPEITVQYDAMAMVGYRDEKESFLVDFEQKRWNQQLQDPGGSGRSLGQGNGAEVGRESDTPDAIVRRHHGPVFLLHTQACLQRGLHAHP